MGFTRICSLLIAVGLSSASVRAQDSQPVKRDLRFEVSSETRPPYQGNVMNAPLPTHVAVIDLPKPVKWLDKVNMNNLRNGILHTPAGKTVSPAQGQYVSSGVGPKFLWPSGSTPPPDLVPRGGPRPIARIEISSPSEDDARKMVEALLQWTDQAAAETRADTEASLKRSRERLAAAEKDLPELEPRLKAARAEREGMEKVIAYSGAEDATRDILELDKALRSVEIDLTVARAKQKAIQDLLNRVPPGRGYPTNPELMNQMLAAQDVEMAGVLARKSALEAERQKAVHYRDLVRQIEKDSKRLDELTKVYRVEDGKRLTFIVLEQQRIAELEGELADIQPLTVAGDKITIYPVAREGSDSSRADGPGRPVAPSPSPSRK